VTILDTPKALDATLFAPTIDFLMRPGKALRARLVEMGWTLGGGVGPVPAELPSLLELVHAGSLIVDDIEDELVRAPRRAGAPPPPRRAARPPMRNWLYFLPLQLLPISRCRPRRNSPSIAR
jgi:hypothetical protein